MKKIDKGMVIVVTLITAFCVVGFAFEPFNGHLISIAGFVTFVLTLEIIVDRFSQNPAAGMTCVALTDLEPEGKIDFADKAVDARAIKDFSIKSGEKCVIIDFKRGIFTKGIYVVKSIEENTEF